MRVLHVDTGTGWRGGQQQVLWLLDGCRELGMDQLLLAPTGSPLAVRARHAGVAVAEIAPHSFALDNLRTVRRAAPEFDLIHAHDAHAHSMVFAAYPFAGSSSANLVVSRRVGFPVGSVGRTKYRFASLYIAISEFVRWRLIDAGVPAGKIRVVRDGVRAPAVLPDEADREETRRRHGADAESFVIGTLSSFAPEKLLEEQLALLERLPDRAHYWLGVPVSESDVGGAGSALLETARRLGLSERFHIVPVSEDPGAFLSSLDLFLYLSRMEGLGSAILLAMAYQLPVVASEVGGIPEIVRPHQTGVLVREPDEREFPAAVHFLMSSPDLRRRMGEAGRQFVLEQGTSDRMVAQTVASYQELTERLSEGSPGNRA